MKILIVKLGAIGDVLRTTPILRVLKGEKFWLTSKKSYGILKRNPYLKEIFVKEKDKKVLKEFEFDWVINLDEEEDIAKFISKLNYKKISGVYYDFKEQKLKYTPETSCWFDMSLISKFGKKKADELKWKNRKSYQELIFEALGFEFKGEEYILNIRPKQVKDKVIALEKRAGEVWPSKKWFGYDLLYDKLKDQFKVFFLKQRKTLEEYILDINNCKILVTGDTLALHIGLALKKYVIGIFTCTSPWEIYDYGRLVKIISPKLKKFFYTRKYCPEATRAISVEKVLKTIYSILKDDRYCNN